MDRSVCTSQRASGDGSKCNRTKPLTVSTATCVLLVAIVLLATLPRAVTAQRRLHPYQHRRLYDKRLYCGNIDPTCCPSREDECHTGIRHGGKDHLCYCDEFCDQLTYTYPDGTTETHHPDCCPDFDYVCRNAPTPTPPITLKECQLGTTQMVQCNRCTCAPTADRKNRWDCEDRACLLEQFLFDAVSRSSSYGWTPSMDYPEFQGKPLEDGIRYYLGAVSSASAVIRMTPIKVDPNIALPFTFDARAFWSGLIGGARNQGQCAVSYAVSTVDVMSDRKSIDTNRRTNLSLQHLISCAVKGGCEAKSLDVPWYYLTRDGLVSEECYPYSSGITQRSSCATRCPGTGRPFSDRPLKSTPAYRLSQDVDSIKFEIRSRGPVQALMEVKPDFYMYKRGVYRDTKVYERAPGHSHSHAQTGMHAVRIIGWGNENGQAYWLVMNSWGESWGENGAFKIRQGANECGIESFVVGARPTVSGRGPSGIFGG